MKEFELDKSLREVGVHAAYVCGNVCPHPPQQISCTAKSVQGRISRVSVRHMKEFN